MDRPLWGRGPTMKSVRGLTMAPLIFLLCKSARCEHLFGAELNIETSLRAFALNALFDEWDSVRRGQPVTGEQAPIYGTVDWLFREYKQSKAYLEKVAPRSRPDYERTMLLVSDLVTKKGDRLGQRKIKSITPVSADKIYEIIIAGPRGERLRQGEKAVALCRRAWRVVHRLHPNEFDKLVPNPWDGVTRKRRIKKTKAAVTREQVYPGFPG